MLGDRALTLVLLKGLNHFYFNLMLSRSREGHLALQFSPASFEAILLWMHLMSLMCCLQGQTRLNRLLACQVWVLWLVKATCDANLSLESLQPKHRVEGGGDSVVTAGQADFDLRLARGGDGEVRGEVDGALSCHLHLLVTRTFIYPNDEFPLGVLSLEEYSWGSLRVLSGGLREYSCGVSESDILCLRGEGKDHYGMDCQERNLD